jgi:hypothetical protein
MRYISRCHPRGRLLALPLAALLGFSLPALAQQMEGQPMPNMQMPEQGMPGKGGNPMQRVERQIEQMHKTLKITPEQEPQWQALAKVMRENAANMEAMFKQRAAHFDQMTALESLQSYERIAEAHVANMQRLIPAFTAVYSSLSPEQRKAADDAFRYQQERRRARMMQNGQMPPGQMQPGQMQPGQMQPGQN